jgi:hypothetical protein
MITNLNSGVHGGQSMNLWGVNKLRQWRALVKKKRTEIFGPSIGLGSGKPVGYSKQKMTQKDIRDYLFEQFEDWRGKSKTDDEQDEYQREEGSEV